ncbi:aldehyde dehydrogenase family protein [Acrocarpospora macrocephala]|uniref:Aldehyde dehydrogenase n=1 Tax=Acrocarpospora macrocephala TaxID=150177 RepID=A0A5M3WGC6_9ACTN|nr:aldehyde dehydrogenase family protein [Acrocarpospora macrocephala]GES07172.1 aldehyde dehydrogenase [Acrocarpospora macrocephala]
MSSAQQRGLSHLIDGELVAGSGCFEIVSPWTEQTIAETPRATPEEAARAIAAARRAFDEGPWPRMAPAARAAILRRFAERLQARRDELVHIAIHQAGAVRSLAEGLQTDAPLAAASGYADTAATFETIESQTLEGTPLPGASGRRRSRLVQRVPAGVITAITPFNYPFRVSVQKVFPALAVGCTVILKPHPTTAWDSALMAQAAQEAGVPAGVLNILLGAGPEVGELLVADPRVDKVSFTGSTATGRRIMELASATVKNVILELGGKSANIVCADADLEKFFATEPGNLKHAGQGCGQLTRVLIEEEIYAEVTARIAEQMRRIPLGEAEDPSTGLGPLANRAQFERVLQYIEIGRKEGATLMCGGEPVAERSPGFRVQPTLFTDVRNDMRIAQEEIFGPVLVAIPFSGAEEAIRIADDSIYGINASVWSRDTEKAWRIAASIRTGSVGVNCLANVTAGPHGGFKQTGIGREWGKYSLDEYVELRAFEVHE